jgi:integrase
MNPGLTRRHDSPAATGTEVTFVSRQIRRQKGERHERCPYVPRHAFCFAPGNEGVPASAIQELAGHTELGVTRRDTQLSQAALDAGFSCSMAVARWLATKAVGSREVEKSRKKNSENWR